MEPTPFSARRATLEDLPALQALWQQAGLPADELERFLTEFQVVTGDDGGLLAAIGLLVEGEDALLHTEALSPAADADELRAALWHRLQIVARNQGIHRLWTQEDADYWLASGFAAASPAKVAEAKATFVDKTAAWSVSELIDPEKAKRLAGEQMAIWQAARAQEAEELQGKIRMFRNVALLVAAAVVAVMGGMVFFVLSRRPELLQRFLHGGH